MHVAVCSITIFMPAVGSLKGKRQIVKSMIGKIRSRTQASVAETGFQDIWHRAEIGVAIVSSDKGMLDKQINLIRVIADDCSDAETVEFLVDYI